MNQAIASRAVMAALAAMFAVGVAAQTGVIAPDTAGAAAGQGGTSGMGAASAAHKPMTGEHAATTHAKSKSKSAAGAAHPSARMGEHPGAPTAGRRAESQYHAALRKCVEQNPMGQRDSCLQEAIDRHARG